MGILDGKTAIVTGAGRGLGWGIALALGQAGARVCICDINDGELACSAADLRADGSTVYAAHLDVSDLSGWQSLVDGVVQRWGRLDAIVQNAVYMPLVLFENTSPELWWRQIQVSLGGLFNATKAAWDVYRRQGGGHIMAIASGSSTKGFIHEVPYCTGKHGQEGFVKALSLEARPYKIALNTLGPGKIIKPTDITRAQLAALSPEETAGWADPVELGKAFAWLAAQPTDRFSGFRFDAGVISDTIAREGWDFEFTPEKVTLLPDDFRAREKWYAGYGK
jgi:3-oxoacyl-[acyl-carrier protein] reductase